VTAPTRNEIPVNIPAVESCPYETKPMTMHAKTKQK
jgi:hypothetical protein